MKDFLGQTYDVGDNIIYAAMSGQSITMVLATVLEIHEKKVVVEPSRSSRWKQHGGRKKYIDTRTGKGINPDYERNGVAKHVTKQAHMRDKKTGYELPSFSYKLENDYLKNAYGDVNHFDRYKYLEYVPVVYKDYVQETTVPSRVTLTVTKNIVKWDTTEVPPDEG